MTVPYTPGPDGWQPPVPPVPPPRRRLPLGAVIGLVVLALIVLCGGVTAIGALAGDPSPKPTAAGSQRRFVEPAATTAAADPGPAVTPVAEPAPSPTPSLSTPSSPARTRTAAPAPRVAPATTRARPKPVVTTRTPRPSATTRAPLGVVHPGAFCAPKGALGRTSAGTLMECKPSATDTRNRWRKA